MPICRDCHGTGQREIKTEITTRCPDCNGSKQLADGSTCERCNKWGEIGSGEFELEKQLCKTCWGSGKVTENSLTVWFLARVVPITLLLLGGGIAAMWVSWVYVGQVWLTALLTIIFFGGWGGLVFYFAQQLPNWGEISVTNWFLIRALPTTLAALGVGVGITWLVWFYSQNIPATAIVALAAFAIWGTLIFFFISHLPE